MNLRYRRRRTLFLGLALPLAAMASLSVASSSPFAVLAATGPASAAAQATEKKRPAIDPNAKALLSQSVEKLRSLQTYSVHADATQDEIVRDGFKVQRQMTEDIVVRRPDRMHAEVVGDKGKRVFVYDGKSLSLFVDDKPAEKKGETYYATVPGAPTLGATLDAVTSRYDLDLPLTDLLYMAAGGEVGTSVTEAGVIGTSRVAGADCDHLAFRTPKVDWQIWIERGGNNALLPRKVVLTTRDMSFAPEYQAVLTWNTTPKIIEGDFVFKPPEGARPITIRRLDQAVPAASTKPAK